MNKPAIQDQANASGSCMDDSLYRRIHESMRDAFVMIDMAGNLVEWNSSYQELLGYSREELAGKRYADLMPPACGEAEARIFAEQVIPHGESRLYEKECVCRDGRLLPVEQKAHLLRDSQGKPEAIWAIVRDISERKRMEALLREQEEFFRLVTENVADFIAVLDLTGKRIYNSRSYQHFFGNPKLMVGSDSFNEIHPEDRERVKEVFRQTVETGIGQRMEYRFVLPDGAIRFMESRGGVIRDREGHIHRIVVVGNDITERKQSEEQIYQLAFYDTLTGLTNRRLLNERLRQSIAATRRSGRHGALMFIDLDNFKPINDTHGHGVGDLLLKEASSRIAACVREVDTVARFGGDEFVVVLNDLDTSRQESSLQATLVAEKIRVRLGQPYNINVRLDGVKEINITHACTASIGLVLFLSHEDSEEDLIKWADIAMYQAKEQGRNRVRMFDL